MLQIKNPPKKIYVIGNIGLLKNKSIAIVGTRNNTEYGEKYTKEFANEISKKGITVVSGLAKGIDAIAHKNSMKNKGRTIAVMGSGFNNIFPKENTELFNEILENDGCIISEYAPNEKEKSANFPIRNRIIAGLSKGVLVMEAKERSGSSITARYGFEQEKPVFCIPNKIGVKTGVGTNNLIKKGAILVTNAKEILLVIGEKINEIEENHELQISEEYKSIYELLEREQVSINQLAKELQENIIQINQKITLMELEGLIEVLPGNILKIKE